MPFDANSLNRKLAKLRIKMVKGRPDVDHLVPVRVSREDAESAQEWCQTRFKDEWIWSSPTQTDWTLFYFKTSQDALVFKLAFAGSITA